MSANKITGRSAFLALLKDEGITHLFGNPGTTELPIMDALSEHPDLNYLMSMQESLVVYMAEGYSRASGKLSACNVHVAPGLGNAMGAIYAAKFANTPIIITAGQQELGHGLTEPLLYDPLVPIAEPLVKWAVEVSRLQDLPRIVRRAAKIAMTPPMGPVFISLPGDILNEEDALELGSRTRIQTKVCPTEETLNALADRIIDAKNPVILAGHEIATDRAFEEAANLADVIGCAVYQQTVQYGAHFKSTHPCFMGALSLISMNSATRSTEIAAGKNISKESVETTHYSVMDNQGNVVGITTTLNMSYGNKKIVDGAGFLLNNEMDDFSSKPGIGNAFGLIGYKANAIAPFKRPLSSMSPTIIIDSEGTPILTIGAAGGSRIITAVLQTIISVVDHDLNIQQAIDIPRTHSQWLPDNLRYEKNSLTKKTISELEVLNHIFEHDGAVERGVYGLAQTHGVQLKNNKFITGFDKRGKYDENEGITY